MRKIFGKKIFGTLLLTTVTVFLLAGCGADTSPSGSFGSADPSATSASSLNHDISTVSREDGSGTRGAFIELFGIEQKNADGSKKDLTTKDAIVTNNTGVMMTNVSGDKYAIGYLSLGSLNETVKTVSIDGVAATAANVKNDSYAIKRPFNIATKGEPTGVAKDFISYILSKDGQAVVAASYIAVDDNAAAFTSAKPSGKIVITGSSSVSPIMEKLKEAYLAINSNAQIELQQSDSSAGMTDAMNGNCDIGMASRGLKDTEKAQLTDTQIALDGIAVIVNKDNPVANLTKDQVKAIFTGKTTNWSEVK